MAPRTTPKGTPKGTPVKSKVATPKSNKGTPKSTPKSASKAKDTPSKDTPTKAKDTPTKRRAESTETSTCPLASSDNTINAASALLKFTQKQIEEDANNLLADDNEEEYVYCVITSKRFVSEEKDQVPTVVNIPHGLWTKSSEQPSICLLSQNPQNSYKRALKDATTPALSRVVGTEKLRGKFKPYEARRQLFAAHDIFVVDEQIVEEMPFCLGKSFYKNGAVKLPLPITVLHKKEEKQTLIKSKAEVVIETEDIDVAATQASLANVLTSTWYLKSRSNHTSVRIATTLFSPKEIAANVYALLDQFANELPSGFDGVRSVYLKTSKSPALPIYLADNLYTQDDVFNEDEEEEEELIGQQADGKFIIPKGLTTGEAEEETVMVDGHKLSALDAALAEVVDLEDILEHNRWAEKNKQDKKRKRVGEDEGEKKKKIE